MLNWQQIWMEMSVIVVKGLFVYKFKKTMYTIVYAKML